MRDAEKKAVSVRALRAEDLAFANAVRQLAGWNQTEHDWRGYLEYEPTGCFIADVDGKPAGTATTIRYADRFGWIGMVLVHPDQRRHGVGTTLLRHTIDYLQRAGVDSIKLDATPMGKHVYVPIGFVDEYEISRYEGVAPVATGGEAMRENVSALGAGDIDAVARFDEPVFGAERARVIASLRGRNPAWCFVARDGANVTGYLIARQGASAVQIGPWMARDAATAEDLWRAVSSRIAGKRVYIDVPAPNAPGVSLMQRLGFKVQRTLTRMFFGKNTSPGTPEKIYSTGGPEKG
ncbi:MAG TPA: GNAT family N-acetyltransferase [Opitutaceae bacterium]|nr:GNAT family N-acetyltransferase [Opitutaceae bacterium]